ncbi:gephyrin-like molybdotransferase Glp [Specibacter cremeus]|uniref:molybdopterin molybdotransferase MoeA n=1 Tax=Specibacter cremeus TaxID=1629051 RepID=UPI000F77330C|nr:gephyrin-like molybdotransferase Glp [Specibacter cremeus]
MRRTVAEHRAAVQATLAAAWAGLADDAGTRVPLREALGRVLAADLAAPIDLPPFANSQMDGFAIRAADSRAGGRADGRHGSHPKTVDSAKSTPGMAFTVAGTIAAGTVPPALQPGFAAPIMTGAMMPDGADAVVPVEDAVPARFPAAGDTVHLPHVKPGTFVRHAGSDLRRGAVAIAAGTPLNAAHIGLASALGFAALTVRRRIRALLVTTGDEVLLPGDPAAANGLPAGKIYDSNSALLRAALVQAGVDVVLAPVVPDRPAALLAALDELLTAHRDPGFDLVVSTGGISAGAFEVVKQALGDFDVDFIPVALQPGGPQALGTYRGVPFLGFPGNPVSGFVSFELFLRPALAALTGAPAPRHVVSAALAGPLTSPAGKHQVRRGVYEGPGYESRALVREVGGPSSHLVGALAAANALIHIPPGVTALPTGAKVEVWLL